MSQTLAAVITALQTRVATLAGIRYAPAAPPESSEVFPFAFCYPLSGQVLYQSANFADYLHILRLEIHISREILQNAITTALPYVESLPALILADPTVGGTAQEVAVASYQFGRMEYAGTQTIGLRFDLTAKLHLEGA